MRLWRGSLRDFRRPSDVRELLLPRLSEGERRGDGACDARAQARVSADEGRAEVPYRTRRKRQGCEPRFLRVLRGADDDAARSDAGGGGDQGGKPGRSCDLQADDEHFSRERAAMGPGRQRAAELRQDAGLIRLATDTGRRRSRIFILVATTVAIVAGLAVWLAA